VLKVKVYIGYDVREDAAYRVAKASLYKTSGILCETLCADRLRSVGLYNRNIDARNNQFYDLPSQAPCSTEFATTRFLVPIICQDGMALFTDCDVVFMDDVRKMLNEIEPGKAVYVVKHNHAGEEGIKMDGQTQTKYPRKNWSSVMLFDCDHPANKRLPLESVNRLPGRELHGFYWLADDEIGELPQRWNWLVNVADKPDAPGIAHFTLGGPWLPNWEAQDHDHLWSDAMDDLYGAC
jgi:lipopolysaccharide biosynthesis glycosyltransferase